MTDAPVPLAEDIAALGRIIDRLRLVDRGFGEDVLRRVIVTLQQHERAMAVVNSVRAFSDSTDANELDAERAMFDALAAFDAAEDAP